MSQRHNERTREFFLSKKLQRKTHRHARGGTDLRDAGSGAPRADAPCPRAPAAQPANEGDTPEVASATTKIEAMQLDRQDGPDHRSRRRHRSSCNTRQESHNSSQQGERERAHAMQGFWLRSTGSRNLTCRRAAASFSSLAMSASDSRDARACRSPSSCGTCACVCVCVEQRDTAQTDRQSVGC